MNLVGLMLVRNSDWVIGLSLRAALLWCDSVVVMMHNCTDGTSDIVAEIACQSGRVIALVDNSAEWEEMRLRQTMLEAGRELLNGTHFALIDDDEVLTGNLLSRIRKYCESIPDGGVLFLPWLQFSAAGYPPQVMSSGIWANQNVSLAFSGHAAFHWEARDGYDFHHRNPMGLPFAPFCPVADRGAGVMHFQFVSRRRLLAKQFLYQLTEMKRWPGRKSASEVAAYYSQTVTESEAAALSPVPDSWWLPYAEWLPLMKPDLEPWQEAECKRLLRENPSLSAGLNDFGLLAEWEGRKIKP